MSSKPQAALLAIPYEKTVSFRKGTVNGPEKILNCFDTQLEIYDRYSECSPSSLLSIVRYPLSEVTEMHPQQMVATVKKKASELIGSKVFTIALGGEHTITLGMLQAWNESAFKDKITILNIDAHLDLRETNADYSGDAESYAHSCVMKRAVDLGFNVVCVGTRAYADFEKKTAQQHNVSYFEWPQKEDYNLIAAIIEKIDTEFVYISIDIDGIDPSHMPATGTPVQGGLGWYFTIELLKALFTQKEVVGADIVEVSPREGDSLTEYGAAQLAYSMLGFKFRDKN